MHTYIHTDLNTATHPLLTQPVFFCNDMSKVDKRLQLFLDVIGCSSAPLSIFNNPLTTYVTVERLCWRSVGENLYSFMICWGHCVMTYIPKCPVEGTRCQNEADLYSYSDLIWYSKTTERSQEIKGSERRGIQKQQRFSTNELFIQTTGSMLHIDALCECVCEGVILKPLDTTTKSVHALLQCFYNEVM